MSDEDDDIQRQEKIRRANSSLFSHDLINFIIPNNNTGRLIVGTDIEHARRIYDFEMRKAVTYLRQIYRIHARKIFSEIIRQDWLDIHFFKWYVPELEYRLFRRGVMYDTFLHFSVFLVCLASIFNRHGLHFAPDFTFEVVRSLLRYRHPLYDIDELQRIAENYTYFHNVAEVAEVSLHISQGLIRSSQKVMRFIRTLESIHAVRATKGYGQKMTNRMKLMNMFFAVGDPLLRVPTKYIFSFPKLRRRRRRRRHSVKNNTGNRYSPITSPPLDYVAIPGTSRDPNPGVMHPIPEGDQLRLTSSLRSQRSNKSQLSECENSKKANFNKASPNNQVMQCKNFRNKTNNPKSTESTSSDTE